MNVVRNDKFAENSPEMFAFLNLIHNRIRELEAVKRLIITFFLKKRRKTLILIRTYCHKCTNDIKTGGGGHN